MEGLWTLENLQNMASVLARILGLVLAIPFHEVAHAWVSDKLGDPTARLMGRLTLNPIKHIDVLGLLSMLIIGVGWAKPVPVNPAFYKNKKGGMALTAVAGPVSNLVLGFGALILYKAVGYGFALGGVYQALWAFFIRQVLQGFVLLNIMLALFNLIPVPPLDGSRILLLILPEQLYFRLQKYERYIMMGMLVVLVVLPRFFNINLLGWLWQLAVWVYYGFDWATGFVDLFFGLFL